MFFLDVPDEKELFFLFQIFRHGAEIKTGYDTFQHFHSVERKRDYKRLPGQKKVTLLLFLF